MGAEGAEIHAGRTDLAGYEKPRTSVRGFVKS